MNDENDQLLSQDPKDYTEADRALIAGLIVEEQQKTRAMLSPGPDASAILIGGVGAPDGIFGATILPT